MNVSFWHTSGNYQRETRSRASTAPLGRPPGLPVWPVANFAITARLIFPQPRLSKNTHNALI
jgi:hypothetical protein